MVQMVLRFVCLLRIVDELERAGALKDWCEQAATRRQVVSQDNIS